MKVEAITQAALPDRMALREALWPQIDKRRHCAEASAFLDRVPRVAVFIVRSVDGAAIGFAEAVLRVDYVNGCETSPVAFLEGIYVDSHWRRRGAARLLCMAVETWAVALGCSEFASDAAIDNVASQRMHEALGFAEGERVVFYRKQLEPQKQRALRS